MTGYLNRLMSTALGDGGPGAAHVSLSPRFAPPPAAAIMTQPRDEPLEREARSESPHIERPVHEPRRERGIPDRKSATDIEHAQIEPMGTPSMILSSPLISLSQDRSVARESASSRDISPSHRGAVRLTPGAPEIPVAPNRAAAASLFDPPNRAANLLDAPAATAPVLPVVAMPPAPHRETRAAPLSATVMSSRIGTARDDRPVIEVTIDRIDVRASPADKPGPPARRQRPEPTVSLSEYLRRDVPGGRL
jgi:hypothetical protein